MFSTLAQFTRPALLVGLIACAMSSQLAAQTAATGFGQAHPNSQNVSLSARWPVYIFHRAGVDYIQVNDANGNVRAAFAHAGNQFLVLPAGQDSQRVTTAPQPQATAASANSEVVYHDARVKVTMIPQAGGGTVWALDDPCGPGCGNTKVGTQGATTAPTAAPIATSTSNVPTADADPCGPGCGNTKQ